MAKNILFICEGGTEERLLKQILPEFKLNVNFEIFTYKTNVHIFAKYLEQNYGIYDLDFKQYTLDMIQILKDYKFESILEFKFTDIILVFDYDPQDSRFDHEKLVKLLHIFSDSTNLG